MVDVSFYHLQAQPLELALPKLLEKVLERGMKAQVRMIDPDLQSFLNGALWSYSEKSFLPHGADTEDLAAEQPILLTCRETGMENGAGVLVLLQDAPAEDLDQFERCLYMFDGNDDRAVQAARARWSLLKEQDHNVTYWQQGERGWQKKA